MKKFLLLFAIIPTLSFESTVKAEPCNSCWMTTTTACSQDYDSTAGKCADTYTTMIFNNPCDGSFDSFRSDGGPCDFKTQCTNACPSAKAPLRHEQRTVK